MRPGTVIGAWWRLEEAARLCSTAASQSLGPWTTELPTGASCGAAELRRSSRNRLPRSRLPS